MLGMDPAIVRHPLARIHLTALRDADTPPARFRWHLHRLAEILFWQASADLDTAAVRVQTPLAETEGASFARPVVLVPILRAGLGLEEAVLPLVPEAVVREIAAGPDSDPAKKALNDGWGAKPGHLHLLRKASNILRRSVSMRIGSGSLTT